LQQREVGADVPDVAAGIAAALDQDLDVLMVGELPDLESLSACLHAAETGHLVLVQVHADDPWDAIARLVEAAPESMQGLVRRTLAATLLGVTSQRLVPATDRGRRAAVGVLVPDDALRAALAAGGSVAGLAGGPESRSVRDAVADLEGRGAIGAEAAAEARASLGRG
jgi:twitching motility protein PilT